MRLEKWMRIAVVGAKSYATTAESAHITDLPSTTHLASNLESIVHPLPVHSLTFPRGKGTPRRKVKKVHKTAGADDKKLQATLKKMNVQPIQAIEEVNMFKEDGNVIHFSNPRGKRPNLFNTLENDIRRNKGKGKQTNSHPSARLRPLQHLRPLRQRRGKRTHRAGSRYLEPVGPGQPRLPPQARRELPEHAEEPGWREEG